MFTCVFTTLALKKFFEIHQFFSDIHLFEVADVHIFHINLNPSCYLGQLLIDWAEFLHVGCLAVLKYGINEITILTKAYQAEGFPTEGRLSR